MKRLGPTLLLLAVLGVVPEMAGTAPGDPPARYVPASGWKGDWQADFYEGWFGSQLRAMNEPVLSGSNNRRHFARRFRMLVLPNYYPAYAVRVDEGATGKMVARVVILDGSGGYSPGRIAGEASFVLRRAQKRRLDAALSAASLPSAPRELQAVSEDGSMTICIHATHFVFELLDSNGAYMVERSCDLAGALQDLAQEAEALRSHVAPEE